MTDHDDTLRRRYREIATEEPSAVIDAAILARARAARPARSRWMGPVSIAAVLVLGIGVSLRMQLEQPGIETSDPLREASPPSEYSLPPAAEPSAPPPSAATDAAKPSSPPKPAAPKSLADAPRPQQGASAFTPSPPPAAERQRPAAPPVSPPPAANALPRAPAAARMPEPPVRSEGAPAMGRVQEAPAAAAPAPLRAKREDAQLDALGVRELRKSVAAEADPARELERIAKLREEGKNDEADAAFAEFRRRHPDYRIPEAMLERVKAR
jgi:hypothetical protein